MNTKRILAAVMACVLAVSMMVSGAFAEGFVIPEGFEPQEYTIAVGIPSAGVSPMEIAANTIIQFAEQTNGNTMFASAMAAATDPDACISFVEQSIAGGANGVVICPPADSILPIVCRMCEEAGVYWGLTLRTIVDEEIRAMCEASEYFVGNCYEDEYEVGRLAGEMLVEAGYTKVGLLSTPKGNTTGDLREQGMIEVLEAAGGKVVAEARGQTQPSEVGDDVSSMMAANPDLEAIFQAASFADGGIDAGISKIKESGKNVKFVSVDSPEDVDAAFESGVMEWFISATGKASLFYDTTMIAAKVINAIQGFRIADEGKTFSYTPLKAMVIDNANDGRIVGITSTDTQFMFFSDEAVAQFFAWTNPALNAETFAELVQTYDPEVSSPYFAK